ncbi:MAG: FkbM family methyltransferase [Candidatus Acidiferrum sp.]
MSTAGLPLKLGSNVYSMLRKYLRTYPQWRFVPPRVQLKRPMERLGSDYGGYSLDASSVRPDSVVYSLGIGEDISFDLSLIDRFGVTVEAFDPTPKVKTWLLAQSLPPQFHFHPVGVAGHDGHETFYLPPRENWVSHSVVPARQFGRDSVRLPVMRLSTAMRLQGHDWIDLLKMDIEGAEYAVIEEILRERIHIKQLLIEFHHRLTSLGTEKTRKALALLEKRGLRISAVCARKEIFTLVQAD